MLTYVVHVTFLVVSVHVKGQTDFYKTVISGHLGAGGDCQGFLLYSSLLL